MHKFSVGDKVRIDTKARNPYGWSPIMQEHREGVVYSVNDIADSYHVAIGLREHRGVYCYSGNCLLPWREPSKNKLLQGTN